MLHRRTISNKPPGESIPDGSFSMQSAASSSKARAEGSEKKTSTSSAGLDATPRKAPPLRRPSSGLYATPVSAPRAKYAVPSPTPSYLSLSTPPLYPSSSSSPVYGGDGLGSSSGGLRSPNGYGYDHGAGYAYTSNDGRRSSYTTSLGYTTDAEKKFKGFDLSDWLRKARLLLDRTRQGVNDAIRLDRSVGLVLG